MKNGLILSDSNMLINHETQNFINSDDKPEFKSQSWRFPQKKLEKSLYFIKIQEKSPIHFQLTTTQSWSWS